MPSRFDTRDAPARASTVEGGHRTAQPATVAGDHTPAPQAQAGDHNTPAPKAHPVDDTRRRFLFGTGAALGGGLLAAALPARSEYAGDHSAAGHGSMMFEEGHDMMGVTSQPPGAPDESEVTYREFDLSFDLVEHELIPGVKMPVFAFNGQVPGPVFRVRENEWIKVNVTNNTPEMHTIHWHGVDLIYTMDGVPMVSHDPIHPQEKFVYRFQAKPYGTRFYHCHWGTPLHMMAALHGAFIIDSDDDPIRQQFPYERDYVLMLESFDIQFARKHLSELLEGMKQVNHMMSRGTLTPVTHAFFKQYSDMIEAIEGGWRPPWTAGNAPIDEIRPTWFGINGKSYPATVGEHGHLKIRQGEYIRVRLINGGVFDHHMHLHGHQFWKVAEDGNPLPQPLRLNTVPVTPGKTVDIVIRGDNPGFWDFHDHKELHTRNAGVYPGGMITMLEYEDLQDPPYVPSITVHQ